MLPAIRVSGSRLAVPTTARLTMSTACGPGIHFGEIPVFDLANHLAYSSGIGLIDFDALGVQRIDCAHAHS